MATGQNRHIAVGADWVGRPPPVLMRQERAPPVADTPRRWSDARLAAVETLWGEGFTAPGGAEEVLSLAAALELAHGDRLLLLGGGLGGPACAITEDSGAWIASFEAESALAEAARTRLAARDCGTRIEIRGFDPHEPDFGACVLDHALSMEALRGADPVITLDRMAASLRPRGQIVMTEMVSDREVPVSDREFAAWCRLENRLPALPSGQTITTALTRLRYDVRVVEDVSTAHVEAAVTGWRNAMQAISRGAAPEPASAAMVMIEAELWLLRIRMMRRFGLRLMRWHAVATH